MLKLSFFRVIFLFLLIATTLYIGSTIYKNVYYLNKLKNIDPSDISSINYIELPKILQDWPGAEKLIDPHRLNLLRSNDKIKRVYKDPNNRIVADVYFRSPDLEDNAEKRSAKLIYTFPQPTDVTGYLILMTGEVEGKILGQGHLGSRMQLEITDINGKKMRGPKIPFIFENKKIYLALRPTITEPIPMGSAQDNFNIKAVSEISVLFIASINIGSFPASGKIFVDNIYLIRQLNQINRFTKPDIQRVTHDNINIGYKLRKMGWDKETPEFFVGINYPWNNYGWDVGKNPYGKPENAGWSANQDKLKNDFTFLKGSGITVVRIYIFFDLRTGLEYSESKLIGFDKYVKKDIEAMFKTAGEVGIKIIPVLFDFGIADGQKTSVGEHPELIFSGQKYNFMTNIVRPLLKDMDTWNGQYGEPVFAVELMNEPENMPALLVPDYYQSLKAWFKDLANIIHNETKFKVTLGSSSIVDMQRWWSGVGIDIWQFHFYKYMLYEHDIWPQKLKRQDVKINGIMFAGEMQPYDIKNNIQALKDNGYNGIMFWAWNSTDGYDLRGKPEMNEIIDWINSNK
ncbi:MAG: hypothetical protein AAB857_02445 [Patescibacteria group bacterium]